MTIKRTLLIALSLVLFAMTSVVQAQEFILQPKVASFNFMIDDSGSMMMHESQTGMKKIVIAKKVLGRINEAIPPLPYCASAETVAPFQPLVAHAPFNPAIMANAINSISTDKPIRARYTNIGDGLLDLIPLAQEMAPTSSVILVTDGANNRGEDPVEALRTFYAANPETCVHFISVADTADGARTLMDMFNLNTCSVMADARTLMHDPVAFNEFMTDVFYTPIEVVDEVIVIDNVLFHFDSSKILPEARCILDEVAKQILAGCELATVVGHTDWIGTEKYNMGLSLRRAKSVRNYLMMKGVPGDRIKVVGKGECDPAFSNETAEGRRQNRRVNILLN